MIYEILLRSIADQLEKNEQILIELYGLHQVLEDQIEVYKEVDPIPEEIIQTVKRMDACLCDAIYDC